MITLDTIELPADLFWQDEVEWTPIEQNEEFSLGGALLIEQGEKLAGRPITLAGEDNVAWVKRSVVEDLMAKAALVDHQMTLTLEDARQFNVMFSHKNGKPLTAEPVVRLLPPAAEDHYTLIIRLMAV